MRKGGRLSPMASEEEAATSTVDIPVSAHNVQQKTWHKLLSPHLVEAGVLVLDVLLIVATGILCSAAYHWLTAGVITNLAPYVGVGIIMAANFAAIMTARRNYRLKRLTLLTTQ